MISSKDVLFYVGTQEGVISILAKNYHPGPIHLAIVG